MGAEVFISYSSQDREQVASWVERLQAVGMLVWIDEAGIDGAQRFPAAIVEAIRQCKVLVLMVSPSSADSPHVLREVALAAEQNKPILPLLLASTEIPAELQFYLAGIQYIPLFRGQGDRNFQSILRSLQRLGIQTAVPPEAGQKSGAVEAPPAPPRGEPVETARTGPGGGPRAATPGAVMRVALLYKRRAEPDEHLLQVLETRLREHGHEVFIDRHLTIGVEWAKEIERQVRSADAVVPLLSTASVHSEMLAYEVQIAYEAAQQQDGKPRLLPVRITDTSPLPEPLQSILGPLHYTLWEEPADDDRLVAELLSALQAPPAPVAPPELEPEGGAVRLDSRFYVVRPTDADFRAAIARGDSIVLVKGARQMGKTSLLARGLQQARDAGARVVLTDLQKLNAGQLESAETLFLTLGLWIARQLRLDVHPRDVWESGSAANINFEWYLREEVLEKIPEPLVWGLDEIDRLFECPYAKEVFGLFRSWHNERALDPSGPWSRLTLAIAYATEAHLFIRDVNQSPFNVGTRLRLEDFTFDQVTDLNRRYGAPLRNEAELSRFYRLVCGQPYLVRRGLHEMTSEACDIADFELQCDRDEGIYGDHLRRILMLVVQDAVLLEVMRGVLRGQPCTNGEAFYRLRSAGILTGETVSDARPRCQLYATYLEGRLL